MADIRKLDVWVFRAPLAEPVRTSFGVMLNRPSVMLRIEDADGAYGFGEVWCNFPAPGAEHRANLLIDEMAELLFAVPDVEPPKMFESLSQTVGVRVLQTGEVGPYAQVLAGIDIALWDLAARREGVPVRRLICETARDDMPAYASGIDLKQAETLIENAQAEGFHAFKVKVGFDRESDIARLKRLQDGQRSGDTLLADANQAWGLNDAMEFLQALGDVRLGWLEEPLRANAPAAHWQELASMAIAPLAAGENISRLEDFEHALKDYGLKFMQPDIAKWGGFTGCHRVAQLAAASNVTYCPHYLGGGIGLIASANLLAATQSDGLLEIDVNPNPLREAFLEGMSMTPDGNFTLGDGAGLGIAELPEPLSQFETMHRSAVAQ